MPLTRKPKIRIRNLIIRLQIQYRPFQLRHLTLRRRLNLRKAVDRPYPLNHLLQLVFRNKISLVDDDNIRMTNLQMRRRQQRTLMLMPLIPLHIPLPLLLIFPWLITFALIQTLQHILRINQRHNPVQKNTTSQAVVKPEQRRNIPRISKPGGLEQNVVKCPTMLD
jgi:hypothetical protein